MVMPLSQPMLTLKLESLTRMENIDIDELSTIWSVFTKAKENLENGRRLENLSWRLWYRSAHPSPSPTSVEPNSPISPTPSNSTTRSTALSTSSFHKILDAASTTDTSELEKFRNVVNSKAARKATSFVARARATASVAPQQFKPGSMSRSSPRHSPRTAYQPPQLPLYTFSNLIHKNKEQSINTTLNDNSSLLLQEQLRMMHHQMHQQQQQILLKRQNPLASSSHSLANLNCNIISRKGPLNSNHLLEAHVVNSAANHMVCNYTAPSNTEDTSRKVTFFISEASPDESSNSQPIQQPQNYNQAAQTLILLQQKQTASTVQQQHRLPQQQAPPSQDENNNDDYDDEGDFDTSGDENDYDLSDNDDDMSNESDYDSDWSNSTVDSHHEKSNLFQKIDVPSSPLLEDIDGDNNGAGSSGVPRIGGGASRTSLSLLSQAIENSELRRAKPSLFSGLSRIVAEGSLAAHPAPPPLAIPNEADLPPPPMIELSESLRQNLESERRMPFGAVIPRGGNWSNFTSNGHNGTDDVYSYSEVSGW